ncbi:uncharacterized protein LOC122391560 isoform X1 [Amphibalanus amphitrite]|uniref:uncharacterized protein LOC122391560 isoform X1 n=1 Tax=Amphibalanus amphitrite TaxID=1232801 RepID=UPI001C8FBDF6|nr:uncharacterized protein LOC122391560 isoform X1 [Amphibalanus amphitrite]
MTAEAAVERLTEMLSQQMETAARDRMEAREREERLTERLLSLATSTQAALQDRQVRAAEAGETAQGARLTTSSLPSAALASAPHLVSGASLREFAVWKDKYKGHCKLTRMSQLSHEEQKAALIALLDDDLIRLLKYSLGVDLDDANVTTDVIIQQIGDHLRKQRNVILDRRDFFQRVQEAGESFNDFLMAIKEIHDFCNFCDHCQDDQLRDKIVTGIRDTIVLEELLADESLTLQKAINICRARENAQCGRDELQSHYLSANRVSAAQRGKHAPVKKCGFCGEEWHADLADCQARSSTCQACGRRGHLAVACRTSASSRGRQMRGQPVPSRSQSAASQGTAEAQRDPSRRRSGRESNGHAEAGVKSVKRLIMKTTQHGELDCDEFARGLLELRNTPGEHGRSPAQILFGHPLQSSVPAHRRAFAVEWQTAAEKYDRSRAHATEYVRDHYNSTAKPLPAVRIGTTVDVQDSRTGQWDRTGIVVGVGDHRDYLVKLPSGRVLWRNRRFLRPHRPLLPCSFRPCSVPSPPARDSSPAERDDSRLVRFRLDGVDAPSVAPCAPTVTCEPAPLRRSERARRAPSRLVINPRLKSYD